jgi:RNA polymerase sigma-70 factor (ECF subfamily)
MGFKDTTPNANSPQILPFPPKKPQPKLPIYIDDEYNRQFYLKYYPMVKDRCMSILHNKEDAEDLSHDVFAYVLEKFNKEGQSSIPYPKTYLSKAAANMGINKKKRARRELIEVYNMATNGSINWFIDRADEEGKEKWEAGIVENGYEQVEAEIIIKAILDEQDETNRKIYFYYYHDGMTLEQISEAVGLVPSTVRSRLKALEGQVRLKIGGGR